jgi:8-amino-7-oxononanoate synthase
MKRDPRALEIALADLERQNLKRVRTTVESFAEPGNRVIVATAAVGAGRAAAGTGRAAVGSGRAATGTGRAAAATGRAGARGVAAHAGEIASATGQRPSRSLVDFSSNDYLALSRHPGVAAAMAASAEHWGAGSGASHLVTGHGIEHARLEEDLAEFTGRERALLFSTGYMANLAVVTSLAGRGETVLLDRLSHASLIDAGLLSGARFSRFAHADADAAERALEAASAKVAVVATDGVFSMDGDIAPLAPLAQASRAHGAWLAVDDAHGLGVIGGSGRGSLEQLGMSQDDVPVLVGTLGKAFGSFGAFVAGSADLIEFLIQKARPYIYTTALPQPVAAATRAALRIARRETWRRERVMALTERFRNAASAMGVPVGTSATPIQPVILGSASAALQAQQELLEAGFWVVAIRPPTVPRGTARLRVTLSAAHTDAQVDALIEALARACARERVTSEEAGA